MNLYILLFFFSDYSDGGVDAKLYIEPIPRTTTEENVCAFIPYWHQNLTVFASGIKKKSARACSCAMET